MRRVYLDHSATTPVSEEVLKEMTPFFREKFGNASSLHSFGQEARRAVEDAREKIAKLIGADQNEIFFTSGGTESDNTALKGVVGKGDHLITSNIEHPAILDVCKWLESQGIEITYIKVDESGIVDPKEVEKAFRKNTRLVSVMHANNEIGTVQPIEEIGKMCRKRGILFHTDAVQSFGKIPVDVRKMNIDMLSASSHKLYGPKGVGCLYIRKGLKVTPLMHGGGHESGRRSGTENVAGVAGFGKACEWARKNMKDEARRMAGLRDTLIEGVLKIPGTILNGHREKRLPNNANFSFGDIEGESLIMYLDMKGIAASTGSACSTKSLKPSHVLTAIGLKPIQAQSSLRLTLGKDNTGEDVKYTIEAIKETVENLRKISPFRKERM